MAHYVEGSRIETESPRGDRYVRAFPVLIFAVITNCVLGGGITMAADNDVRKPEQNGGTIVIPPSSIPNPGDAGNAGHTNVQIYYPPPPTPPTPPVRPQASPDDNSNK
jgi:hypothetical protein